MNAILFFWGVIVGGSVMYIIYKEHQKKYNKILDIIQKGGDNSEQILKEIKKTFEL